jgi:hypothetical protein
MGLTYKYIGVSLIVPMVHRMSIKKNIWCNVNLSANVVSSHECALTLRPLDDALRIIHSFLGKVDVQ